MENNLSDNEIDHDESHEQEEIIKPLVNFNLMSTYNLDNSGFSEKNQEIGNWSFSLDDDDEQTSEIPATSIKDLIENVNYTTLHQYFRETYKNSESGYDIQPLKIKFNSEKVKLNIQPDNYMIQGDFTVYLSPEIKSEQVSRIEESNCGVEIPIDSTINVTDLPLLIVKKNSDGNPISAIKIQEWIDTDKIKIPKIIEVQDINVGDVVRTTQGDLPVSHVMKTQVCGTKYYVKFAKNCLGNNVPSEDFFVTAPHPMCVGFYYNEEINGVKKQNFDNVIAIQILAKKLINKLPGITYGPEDFPFYYNVVFDKHASIDIQGLDVTSHHPKANPYVLPDNKYHDEKLINIKDCQCVYLSYEKLIKLKPDDMELKEYLRKCLTSNKEDKIVFNDLKKFNIKNIWNAEVFKMYQ